MAVVGAAPYISLQLKAINTSLEVLQSSPGVNIPQQITEQLPVLVACSLAASEVTACKLDVFGRMCDGYVLERINR